MNLLDRTISWVSPSIGLRRARARLALGQISRLSYEGARMGRRTEGWQATGTSANTEIAQGLIKLRDRSRDLIRNNPYAAKAVSVLVANAVGTGIIPRARAENLNKLWETWHQECDADDQLDFYGLESLIARSIFESGECLVRFRPRRPADGMDSVPLQLQVLESDYLDMGRTQLLPGGRGYIIQGVEFDLLGTRTAYWLFENHPGDSVASLRSAAASRRIPAEQILHIYRKDRPGQVRGVPWLAPVMIKLRDLDEFQEAELVRKKIEACFAAFVTQPEGMDGSPLAPSSTENGNRIESFEPGMVEYLKPGEEVNFANPTATADASYLRSAEHVIATGAGVMYEQMTGDLSQVNYSSYRAGHLEFRRMVECYRWQVLIPMLCVPVWKQFVRYGQSAGLVPDGVNLAASWAAPKFESIDPEKDANADLTMVRMATKTLGQAIGEQGYDLDTQLKEMAETNQKLDALGLVLDCDPRKAGKTADAKKANAA